jgi:hypothetical protein
MRQRKRVFFFQLAFIAIALLIIEVTLRLMGYQPGDIKPNWSNFEPVDSLYVIKDFYTNPAGFMVADSNYWAKKQTHINEDGFRAPDFRALDTTRKRILLIGDSFTWGMSATPLKDSCFAGLLQSQTNYQILNMGIPVADPVQYEAIAQKYIPQLKPDYVLVFFFMGNDLMEEDRSITPGQAFYYYTNAGGIAANIDGHHFNTPLQAYDYVANQKYYLQNPTHFYEKVIAQSSLLSRLYSFRFRIEEKIKFELAVNDSRITKTHLLNIKQVAAKNGVPLKFVLIPEIKDADMPLEQYIKKYESLLQDTSLTGDWLMLQTSSANFKPYPDGHLNNEGHRLYGDYLQGFLKKALEPK